MEHSIDFITTDHGTIVTFTPLTDSARDTMDEMDLEGWQFMGDGFAVDRRVAWNLIESLLDNGLVVA